MIERIKKILFVISIVYSITIVILMCITSNNMVAFVKLNDSVENKNELLDYKTQLSNLEENDCTKIIGKIIKHYEDTSYNGEVNLRDMFENDLDNSILSYYDEVKIKCSISKDDEDKYDLPLMFMIASVERDEIYEPYYFQYELGLKDRYTRFIAKPDLLNIEYKINKKAELKIISSLIELNGGAV